MNRKYGHYLGIIIFLWVSIFWIAFSYAEISVGPSVTEILLKPGEKSEVVFEVANTWDYDVQVNVDAVNWVLQMVGQEGGREDDVYEWLDFGEYREFVVPKNSLAKLSCDIKAPDGFQGERIAQVYFEYGPANPTKEQAEVAKVVGQRIGLLLCLGAKGGEKLGANMKIEDVLIGVNEEGKDEVTVVYTVRNKGNIHLRPRGSIIIEQGDNMAKEEKIGRIQGLFPGEARTYKTPVKIKLSPGKYRAEARMKALSYDLEKKLEGSKKFSVK